MTQAHSRSERGLIPSHKQYCRNQWRWWKTI